MSQRFLSRRRLLSIAGGGIGSLALADLMQAASPMSAKLPHFAAKAKAVISVFCYGGVSHVDTFDPKPELARHPGEVMPGKGSVVVSQGHPGGMMPSPWTFKKHGQCGMDVSELFPHVATHVDDIAFIRSMYSLSNDHAPAMFQMNTGSVLPGYPSMGSWITYGLGTENQNLPGYIVFSDWRGGPIGGAPNWGNGFMPAAYQGTPFRTNGDPIVDLKPPAEMTSERQRRWLGFLDKLNEEHARKNPLDSELSARIASFELAYQMQEHATRVVAIDNEPEHIRQMYGLDGKQTQYVGRQLLMARRLVEKGVRFVQVYSGGGNFNESWDAHWDLKDNHEMHCGETDQPIAALLTDLKQRGLLESTLVIWHGEFGRMPISQRMNGRDHNPLGYTVWMAGGGIKGGQVIGSTDEFGYQAVDDRKSVNDLHATMLHCLGFDHERLTFPYNGRQMRLTDVAGNVIKPLLA